MTFMFLVLCATLWAEPSPSKKDLDRAMAYLLKYVEQSRCTFIRNGKEHAPEEAVAHIKRKYEYYKKKIKTAEDFIRLTATKSMISGKPYFIKTEEGETVPSQEWFLNALNQYRKAQAGPGTRAGD